MTKNASSVMEPRSALTPGSENALAELIRQEASLVERLGRLRADGVWTGPDHAALCEALELIRRAKTLCKRTQHGGGQ